METKVLQKNQSRIMPAGIIEGIEGFWHDNEKWVMLEGTKMRYHDAPGYVQRMFACAFMNDLSSREYMKRHGVTAFSEAFDWWFRCVVGAYDFTPDFLNGKFTPDSYNNNCTDTNCPHRGKLCGRASRLNSFDVKTLAALKRGHNFRQTAASLYVSEPGLKSRVTKLREKLEARNIAALTARAAEIGI
jgi:hypothetical protein